MKSRFEAILGLMVYLAAGLGALILASLLSSHFMTRAISQTMPTSGAPSASGQVPPPAPPAATQRNAAQPSKAAQPEPAPVQKFVPPPPKNPLEKISGQNSGAQSGQQGAQQNSQLQNSQGQTQQAPAAQSGEALTAISLPPALAGIHEEFNYEPTGKRDPFMPYERPVAGAAQGPLWPLQRYELEQLKLVGIIWDVKNPKAMILDPSGKGFVVKVNERIGRNNGYIARIREGEIIVVESATDVEGKLIYTTKLMKLQTE